MKGETEVDVDLAPADSVGVLQGKEMGRGRRPSRDVPSLEARRELLARAADRWRERIGHHVCCRLLWDMLWKFRTVPCVAMGGNILPTLLFICCSEFARAHTTIGASSLASRCGLCAHCAPALRPAPRASRPRLIICVYHTTSASLQTRCGANKPPRAYRPDDIIPRRSLIVEF